MLMFYQMLPQKAVRFVLTLFFQEKKSLFDDCVGAAYKQEASVNHVITWDTQIFLMLQTPAFKYNINLWLEYYWVKKKHFSKEKAERKDEQILSRYQANPKNIEDKNMKRYWT